MELDNKLISIEGNFYHSAYGLVEVSTLDTPFQFADYSLRALMYNPNSILPLAGMATIRGAEETQARITIEKYDDENTAYLIEADTNGDGSFDTGPIVTFFPDPEETIENFWFYNAGEVLEELCSSYPEI